MAFTDQFDKRNQTIEALSELKQHQHKLVVQPDQFGGDGLFARRRLEIDEVDLSYWGRYYPARSYYLRDYPDYNLLICS